MTISFNQIPGGLRVPFVGAEIDSSLASQGPALLVYRGILIGQKTDDGTAAAGSLHRVTSAAQVSQLAGRGSMLHRMAIAWFASNTSTELWIGVLADDGSAVAAEGTITVEDEDPSGATAGTLALYLGGVRVTVAVAEDDEQDDVAAAINTAINANSDLPVTSSVEANVVTVTFRHGGEVGNGYDMRDSYRDGEKVPDGITVDYDLPSGGQTNPDLSDLIAVLGDSWYHIWSHPYTDSGSLTAIENELASRFGPLRMIDGVAITSHAGSHSALTTLGDGRNSPHSSIVAQPGINVLTPPMEYAAEVAAITAYYGQIDPARPFQTLRMTHALPPVETDRFTLEERNQLLFEGIATTRVGAGDVVRLDRMITTYQEDDAGADDDAYLDVNTPLTLMYLRHDWRVRMQTRYPRHKLADSGTRFGPGQAVMTPQLGLAEAFGWFKEKEEQGLVENFAQFKQDAIAARNGSDPNRLDILLPPDLINQLIVVAGKFQWRL